MLPPCACCSCRFEDLDPLDDDDAPPSESVTPSGGMDGRAGPSISPKPRRKVPKKGLARAPGRGEGRTGKRIPPSPPESAVAAAAAAAAAARRRRRCDDGSVPGDWERGFVAESGRTPTAPSCSRGTRGACEAFGSFSFRGGHTGEWHFLGSAGQMIDCGVILSCRWILSRRNSLIAKKRLKPMLLSLEQQGSRFRSSLDGTSRPRFCRERTTWTNTSWTPAPVRTSP